MNRINLFFERFKSHNNKPDATYKEAFFFDLTKESASHLLELVLSGKKKATASSFHAYQIENEELPKIGEYSIVTDFDGKPYAVIQTKLVTILPFNEMTYEICMREGEDENLLSWQNNHIHFFTEEGKLLGYTFDEHMLVVFEDFEVVYQEDGR